MTGWKIDIVAKGMTSCLQQSEYDDTEVIVSTFITLQNVGGNGFAASG